MERKALIVLRKRCNYEKIISLVLTLVLLINASPMALAASGQMGRETQNLEVADVYDSGYVYVVDEDGKTQAIWVEERTYYANHETGRFTSAKTPEEGDRKTITVKIKNSQLEAGAIIGDMLSRAARTKLESLAAKAVTAKLGTEFAGGVSLVAAVAAAVGAVNDLVFGNDGFEVTAEFRWAHFVNHREGIDEYDWSFEGVSIETY